jgi:integrase
MTKAVARDVEQDRKRKIKLGQWDMIQSTTPTFNEFIPDFILYLRDVKQNRAWDQAESCANHFAKFFGTRKLSEISSSYIEDYKRIKTKEGKKPASVNKDLAIFRHLFNNAKSCNKFYTNNPVSNSGLLPVNNQKIRVLTTEEENLLLNQAEEPLKSIIQIALLTGLRLNSIRTLKWNCVDFSFNMITIESTYSKNKRTHSIPLNTTVSTVLQEAKLKCGNSQYVFPGAMKMVKSGIGNQFRRLCAKLGIHGLRFHDLRHTCGTRLSELGCDVATISKVLWHSSITMSTRYLHTKDLRRKAVEDLGKFTDSTTKITTTERF